MTAAVYWLVAGAALLALEAFGVPGIGFLFAGLGALIVGLVVQAGLVAEGAFIAQWAIFFLSTTLFALLLWKKLKSWRLNPNAPQYSNMVGTEAVVTQPLIGDAVGEVRWSGTLMRARLHDATTGDAALGTTVIVRAMDGNVLLVAPK
ncbi:MAG: hypothetical protein DI582_05400 [Azospirillum brasilense]|nr:MAG: hypothetical protein DI582_05400 [Azospirillum brasilense]